MELGKECQKVLDAEIEKNRVAFEEAKKRIATLTAEKQSWASEKETLNVKAAKDADTIKKQQEEINKLRRKLML